LLNFSLVHEEEFAINLSGAAGIAEDTELMDPLERLPDRSVRLLRRVFIGDPFE
jgi:hypothetical protein